MRKWGFWIIILIFLLSSVQGVLGARESGADSNLSFISEAPLNPEYIEYHNTFQVIKGVNQINFKDPLGYVPEPVDTTYLKGKKVSKKALEAEMLGIADVSAVDIGDIMYAPITYDLRTSGRVSPVKNQGACGSCWAFATYGSMESEALPGQMFDFSENNLKNIHGFDLGPCDGGNSGMSTAYLARWGGPVAEVDDPYVASSTTSPSNLPVQEHAQEIILIPGRSGSLDNNNIKAALQTTSALYTNIYWNNLFYNTSSKAYYYNGTSSSNHAVTIVGWDDTYNRTNFNPISPGDGAFIIKNSWGTSWGDNGYFYQSYYDSNVGTVLKAFTGESAANYNHIYQYDPLGRTQSFGYTSFLGFGSDTAWAANVFTTTSAESLKAVGFYTNQVDTAYQVFIYTNPDQGPISSAGPVSTVQGTIGIPGYHSITLPTPVSLNAGQKFSVVVRFQTPNYFYPVAVEKPLIGYSSQATAGAGQSYTSDTGWIWTDLSVQYPNTNVCLKAYTVNTPPPVAALSATPTTGMAPVTVAFTDTTTGGTPTMWNWSFGDGSWYNTTLPSVRNTTHVYTTIGTYTAYLTVSNAVSTSTSEGRTITVTPPPQLIADFTANASAGTVPLAVQFIDTTVGGTPTMWNWSFGDGSWYNTTLPSVRNATHIYTTVDTFTVYLAVSNAVSTSTSGGRTITITPPPQLIADFTANTSSGTVPLAVQFIDTTVGGTPTMWNWSFGDGSWYNTTLPSVRNATHIYTSDGIFTVYLIASNAGDSSTSAGKTIAIILPPFLTAAFTTNTSLGTAPLTIAFTDITMGGTPTMWNWSFGDGSWFNTTLSSDRNPTHIYTTAGTRTAYLTVSNAGSSSTSSDKTITITTTATMTKIGIYNAGNWYIDSNGDGLFTGSDRYIPYGASGWTQVVGDWNGDGNSEIGIYKDAVWYIDHGGSGVIDANTRYYQFGAAGWMPVTGDWNGDKKDEIGVYQNGNWYLDYNGNGFWDAGDKNYGFGATGWTPIVGKWTADGISKIGVYNGGNWYIDSNGDGLFTGSDKYIPYGATGWTQLVGDWNGDGKSEIGIYKDAVWYIDYGGSGVIDANTRYYQFGATVWMPVTGDWNSDKKDKIAVYQNGNWYLDYNGNGFWDTGDKNYGFGAIGWIPVVGKW